MKRILAETISLIAIAIVGGLLGWLLVIVMDKWVAHEQVHQQYIAPADEVIIEIMNKE